MKQGRKLMALISTISLGLMGRAAAVDRQVPDHQSASTVGVLSGTLSDASVAGGDSDGTTYPPTATPPGRE